VTAAGSPAAELLKTPLIAAQLPHDMLQRALTILLDLQNGQRVDTVPHELNAFFRPSVQDYVISWFALDPAKELVRVTVPVLIVSGGQDIQVPIDEAKKLDAVGKGRWVHIENMNHILKPLDTDRVKNLASYSNPHLKLAPELLPALVSFIQE
jgi:pimeloyl-ACP methyl ester carboxylesterase